MEWSCQPGEKQGRFLRKVKQDKLDNRSQRQFIKWAINYCCLSSATWAPPKGEREREREKKMEMAFVVFWAFHPFFFLPLPPHFTEYPVSDDTHPENFCIIVPKIGTRPVSQVSLSIFISGLPKALQIEGNSLNRSGALCSVGRGEKSSWLMTSKTCWYHNSTCIHAW